jgi:small nuclear ribonucleoprotein (snRNP)-like protein
MPGRESEYMRGYLRGVAAMMNLISSDKVKRLDKTNVLQYARELVEAQKEKGDPYE